MNMFLFTRRYSCTLAPCRFAIRRLPPPRHHVHSADPRTFFLVDWCEYLHPVVSLQLPEVLSTHETSELTVRWPIIKMPQPEGPGIAVGVDYFDPLPVTPRGNTDIQLFTDRFSHRADMSAVTAAEFVAARLTFSSTGMFPSGDSRAAYSGNGLQFCSTTSHAVSKLLAVRKIAISPYHSNGNGGVEHVNYTMAQMIRGRRAPK